jgi:hypothetical protein
MRKRSKYRPKRNLQDPVSWVINGFAKIDVAAKDLIDTVRIKNHMAMNIILQGKGTRKEVGDIMVAFKIAHHLAERGLGRDWIPEIAAACDAIESMRVRGEAKGDRFLFNGEELKVVNLGMEVHDAQLDNCTLAQMEQAVQDYKRR